MDTFQYNLYWAGYKDNQPQQHVREELLVEGKYAFHLPGYDADSLFVTLAQRLGCFPPDLIERPFSYLGELISHITEYKAPNQDSETDIVSATRQKIDQAISTLETSDAESAESPTDQTIVEQARLFYLTGDYDRVLALYEDASSELRPQLANWAAWSSIVEGNVLSDLALRKEGEEADRLFNDSIDKYTKAVEIKPDMHEAWYNWGISLAHMARRKEGEEADRLLEQAREKMSAAEQLSSGYAVYNLARVAALQGDPEEAKEWLLKTREHGKLPTLKHIQEDSDLDSLRDEPWFKELIEELEAGKSSS